MERARERTYKSPLELTLKSGGQKVYAHMLDFTLSKKSNWDMGKTVKLCSRHRFMSKGWKLEAILAQST